MGHGKVAKAWDESIPKMSKGSKSKIVCTPEYAYGNNINKVPKEIANKTINFEIELFGIDWLVIN